MFCKLCKKNGKNNTMTEGCETFKTNSMTRHENTSDHKSSIKAPELRIDFQTAVKKANTNEDLAMLMAIKSVYWLALWSDRHRHSYIL